MEMLAGGVGKTGRSEHTWGFLHTGSARSKGIRVCLPQELPGYARISKKGQRWWSGGLSHQGDQHVMGGGMVGRNQGSWVLSCGDAEMGELGKKVMGLT